MAEPADSSVILEDIYNVHRELYMKEYPEEYSGYGTVTNKLFKPSSEIAGGDGIQMQSEIAPIDTMRSTTDMLASIPTPSMFQAINVKARLNTQVPGSNDFVRFAGSVQVADVLMQNGDTGTVVDIADRLYKQVSTDYEEKLAISRHVGRTARLGLVNGTPKQDNIDYFADATATASNANGARFPIDTGSIAYFKKGRRVDIFNATTGLYIAQNVKVTSVNTVDYSIGLEFVSAAAGVLTGDISTGNLANIADNHEIYLSGQRNQGMYGFGAWFNRPAATGDSFIGGVNRMATSYRNMIPTTTRFDQSSNAVLTRSMFDDLALGMQYRQEDEYGVVFLQDLLLTNKIRQEVTEQAIIQLPVDDSRLKRFSHFGTIGLLYQHPAFGVCQIIGDPLAMSNTVRVLTPETWRTYFAYFRGLMTLPGIKGSWYRVNESAPNTGDSVFWKSDWHCYQLDWCKQMWRNGAILSVSPS